MDDDRRHGGPPRSSSQMQTLADQVGFEHVHHAPIAPDANKVRGFPQDAFMDMGMDEAVGKPGKQWPAEKLERHDDGDDDAGPRAAGGTL